MTPFERWKLHRSFDDALDARAPAPSFGGREERGIRRVHDELTRQSRSFAGEPGPGFTDRVLAALPDRAPAERRPNPWQLPLVAAAAAAVLAGAWLFLGADPAPTAPAGAPRLGRVVRTDALSPAAGLRAAVEDPLLSEFENLRRDASDVSRSLAGRLPLPILDLNKLFGSRDERGSLPAAARGGL